ncbi:MAG TPA: ribose-phosphate pyrophosphokinase-like domain-containing protein, partial [Candidatus Mediterraneibacter excrementigallinarum]|nr:ribose-phosphate pyrophosphokinase-like domain-containing protein [Candidatus Mediterraneibacter excrementigallinarum]
MSTNIELLEKTLPVAPLKIAAMESCRELGQKVNDYIVSFRENTINEVTESPLYVNYKMNNYLVDCTCPRFGTGEAKGVLKETIRG